MRYAKYLQKQIKEQTNTLDKTDWIGANGKKLKERYRTSIRGRKQSLSPKETAQSFPRSISSLLEDQKYIASIRKNNGAPHEKTHADTNSLSYSSCAEKQLSSSMDFLDKIPLDQTALTIAMVAISFLR